MKIKICRPQIVKEFTHVKMRHKKGFDKWKTK
jgi:hypothetical protein